MALRVIQAGLGRPVSYPVDPNAVFEPGMIAQLKVIGNDVVMGVSDGIAPIGIIDDIKTTAISQAVLNEEILAEVPVSFDGYNFVSTMDIRVELRNAYIVGSSFRANYPGLILNNINGVITIPAGSVANFAINSATNNAVRFEANYSHQIAGMPGEDSTIGSGKMTIWFTRGIFQTDQFEMVPYKVGGTLFVSSTGKLTAEQGRSDFPGIAMCLVPPTGHNSWLEFMWM